MLRTMAMAGELIFRPLNGLAENGGDRRANSGANTASGCDWFSVVDFAKNPASSGSLANSTTG